MEWLRAKDGEHSAGVIFNCKQSLVGGCEGGEGGLSWRETFLVVRDASQTTALKGVSGFKKLPSSRYKHVSLWLGIKVSSSVWLHKTFCYIYPCVCLTVFCSSNSIHLPKSGAIPLLPAIILCLINITRCSFSNSPHCKVSIETIS